MVLVGSVMMMVLVLGRPHAPLNQAATCCLEESLVSWTSGRHGGRRRTIDVAVTFAIITRVSQMHEKGEVLMHARGVTAEVLLGIQLEKLPPSMADDE
jgi:hypothetical protein